MSTQPHPGARGGRAAKRANDREREQDRLEARGVIVPLQTASEKAWAESYNCPICRMRVHPTNWSKHMQNNHPENMTPIHEAEPGRLPLLSIRLDGGTQSREQIDFNLVADYADKMKEGKEFPAIDVWYDGESYWVSDGFHRIHAAKQAGLTDIKSTVHQGSLRDAILHSVGVNDTHGLRRTNADKHRAVNRLLDDSEWGAWSNSEIARRCVVSEFFVRSLRSKRSDGNQIRTYTTKHGTTATMHTGNIGKSSPPVQPFVEKAEISKDGHHNEMYAPKATTPIDRFWEIKNKFAPKTVLLASVYLNGPIMSGRIAIGDDVKRLMKLAGCRITDSGYAVWVPAEKAGYVASCLGHWHTYNYSDDGRALVKMYFPDLLGESDAKQAATPPIRYGKIEDDYQPDVPSVQVEQTPPVQSPPTDYTNPIEEQLGGRGAKVRARSGQEGILAFVQGRNAHVDTLNGRRVYDALYLRKVEETTLPSGTAYVMEDGNYKRDSKTTRPADAAKSQPFDYCLTPPYALDPLLPYLGWSLPSTIWEPAAGEGLLVEGLYDAGWTEEHVIGTDILTGHNFFEYQPDKWEVIVTNPPFSLKFEWLERCYALGKPFALLLPVEVLGTVTAQALMQKHGFEIMLLDSRVDFKMPNAGWEGAGAQFPVLWLCHDLLPEKVMFGSIKEAKKAFKAEIGMAADDDPE